MAFDESPDFVDFARATVITSSHYKIFILPKVVNYWKGALDLDCATKTSSIKKTGGAGLEPATYGFGDRCSAKLS